jgi:ppGpp synthetase/RelA/SpoT-type nucleotidyltranferase
VAEAFPSRSQIRKAASAIRQFDLARTETYGDYLLAMDTIQLFRAAHQTPLVKANMGLRSIASSESVPAVISQRLKRMATIMDKLHRHPTMDLSRMQDIGGCRAVVESIEELRRMERKLKHNRPPVGYDDYIVNPRASGYRAVHVVVCYEDQERVDRRIEIQLRTPFMHSWAIAVERLSGRLDVDVKSGYGPQEVQVWLSAISEAMALEERGKPVPDTLRIKIAEARQAAARFVGD